MSSEIFCNQCGHKNISGANFCSACGSPLELQREEHTVNFFGVDSSDATTEISALSLDEIPDGMATLIMPKGQTAGSRYTLSDGITRSGRHPDSDIFLDDVTVSRRHAEFIKMADGFHVRDAGSLNGTYVNRVLVSSIKLSNGDEVQIGKFRLLFYAGFSS